MIHRTQSGLKEPGRRDPQSSGKDVYGLERGHRAEMEINFGEEFYDQVSRMTQHSSRSN